MIDPCPVGYPIEEWRAHSTPTRERKGRTMVKIDRETCPVGTKLLVRVKGLPMLFDWQIVQWASTVEAVKVVKNVGHIGQWLPLVNGQTGDSEVLEIIPASPAVSAPSLPGGWRSIQEFSDPVRLSPPFNDMRIQIGIDVEGRAFSRCRVSDMTSPWSKWRPIPPPPQEVPDGA